jgi:hypothetical protein
MASNSETGHAKNVANLHDLIDFCIGYGPGYVPTKTALKVTSLQSLETDAQKAIADVLTAKTAYNASVNARIQTFTGIKPLATRLVNALQSTSATKELISNAKSYNKKIQGTRAAKIETPTDPNAPVPTTISVAQLSYDQLIQHFAGLIEVLQLEPTYAPNEVELKIATLIAKKNDFTTKNNAVSAAYTTVSNTRIKRKEILYATDTGLVDIALSVIMYIKSVFGATSDKYKQVRGIQFRNVKK